MYCNIKFCSEKSGSYAEIHNVSNNFCHTVLIFYVLELLTTSWHFFYHLTLFHQVSLCFNKTLPFVKYAFEKTVKCFRLQSAQCSELLQNKRGMKLTAYKRLTSTIYALHFPFKTYQQKIPGLNWRKQVINTSRNTNWTKWNVNTIM